MMGCRQNDVTLVDELKTSSLLSEMNPQSVAGRVGKVYKLTSPQQLITTSRKFNTRYIDHNNE